MNNPISIARRPVPVAGAQPRDFNRPPAVQPRVLPRAPVLGAVAGTATSDEVEPKRLWVSDEADVRGNMGNGWHVFPGADQNLDYDTEPSGVLNFLDSETGFQEPAECPQGHPLA